MLKGALVDSGAHTEMQQCGAVLSRFLRRLCILHKLFTLQRNVAAYDATPSRLVKMGPDSDCAMAQVGRVKI